jgi:hypothetical protein
MPDQGLFKPTRERSLMVLRIIWAALIFSQLAFLGVVALVILPGQHNVHPQPILVWVNLAMLVSVVPVMFVLRLMTFRRGQSEAGISPTAYATGNILFWSGCEGVSFVGIVAAIMNGSLWPTIVIVAVAIALQALTFPVGTQVCDPMEQTQ